MKTKLEGVQKQSDGTNNSEFIEIRNERSESDQIYT